MDKLTKHYKIKSIVFEKQVNNLSAFIVNMIETSKTSADNKNKMLTEFYKFRRSQLSDFDKLISASE